MHKLVIKKIFAVTFLFFSILSSLLSAISFSNVWPKSSFESLSVILNNLCYTSNSNISFEMYHLSQNFLQNNEFKVGYYLCYEKKASSSITFFSTDCLTNEISISNENNGSVLDVNSLLFSPNNISSYYMNKKNIYEKYMDLDIIFGEKNDFSVNSNYVYITENIANTIIENDPLINTYSDILSDFSFKISNYDDPLFVCAILSDESSSKYKDFYGEFIYCSYIIPKSISRIFSQLNTYFFGIDEYGSRIYFKEYLKYYNIFSNDSTYDFLARNTVEIFNKEELSISIPKYSFVLFFIISFFSSFVFLFLYFKVQKSSSSIFVLSFQIICVAVLLLCFSKLEFLVCFPIAGFAEFFLILLFSLILFIFYLIKRNKLQLVKISKDCVSTKIGI